MVRVRSSRYPSEREACLLRRLHQRRYPQTPATQRRTSRWCPLHAGLPSVGTRCAVRAVLRSGRSAANRARRQEAIRRSSDPLSLIAAVRAPTGVHGDSITATRARHLRRVEHSHHDLPCEGDEKDDRTDTAKPRHEIPPVYRDSVLRSTTRSRCLLRRTSAGASASERGRRPLRTTRPCPLGTSPRSPKGERRCGVFDRHGARGRAFRTLRSRWASGS